MSVKFDYHKLWVQIWCVTALDIGLSIIESKCVIAERILVRLLFEKIKEVEFQNLLRINFLTDTSEGSHPGTGK